jgi:hypothetical protein
MSDLSKQAILDAKQLRAHITAITKASLEEQFGPKMKKMIQESLEEELDEVEEVEEAYEKPVKVKKPVMKEEAEDELDEMEEIEEAEEEELDESEEDLDESEEELDEVDELEEVLKELDAISEYESELEEDDEEGEEEEGGEEMSDEMGEEDDEEIVITFGQLKQALAPFMDAEEMGAEGDEEVVDVDGDLEESQLSEPFTKKTSAPKTQKTSVKPQVPVKKVQEKFEDKEKKKMEETIKRLQHELRETNLLSAKNLYMNKIFANKSLSESQKFKVINSFDKAKNVQQVKSVYNTLNESLTIRSKKQNIRESVGFASKAAGVAPSRGKILDIDPTVERWNTIAGLG